VDNRIEVISYKHNGDLHRIWQQAHVVRETNDTMIVVNDKANVIDGDGRRWKTKEPAVCYFYKDFWFNIICMLRNNSIYYYCNLSSPYVKDVEGLKYIDYELDVKVFPSGDCIILDRDEFEFNQVDFHYSPELIDIIEKQLQLLLERIKNKQDPFNNECVFKDYEVYQQIKKSYEKKK
jgi:protein associated with RNAse G/E